MTAASCSRRPAVRRRGSDIVVISPWTRAITLDRAEQLGNMLFSGLIHLDHRPLHMTRKGESLQLNQNKSVHSNQLCTPFYFIPLKNPSDM